MSELKLIKEFQQVLKDYKVAPETVDILRETKLLLLVSPSAGGDNAVMRQLAKTGRYHYVVSDTTRSPRINNGVKEQNGVEYWFRSEEEMLADLRAGSFLEAAVIHNQQVSGISVRELNQINHEGKVAMNDVEIVGADAIVHTKPDTIAVFLLPPSFEEWQRRLKNRGHMNPAELKRRLESALIQFKAAKERSYYHLVINDDLEKAAQAVDELVTKHHDATSQADCHDLLDELLVKTRTTLEELAE